jgi:hypothetical protein
MTVQRKNYELADTHFSSSGCKANPRCLFPRATQEHGRSRHFRTIAAKIVGPGVYKRASERVAVFFLDPQAAVQDMQETPANRAVIVRGLSVHSGGLFFRATDQQCGAAGRHGDIIRYHRLDFHRATVPESPRAGINQWVPSMTFLKSCRMAAPYGNARFRE